jgi:hypothetical protein
MNNSDKGEKLVSKTTDLEYSTKKVNKTHYLSAQNTEFGTGMFLKTSQTRQQNNHH